MIRRQTALKNPCTKVLKIKKLICDLQIFHCKKYKQYFMYRKLIVHIATCIMYYFISISST